MTTSRVLLGEWLPDQPAIVDSLKDATNVVPLSVGYGSFPASVDYSNAASEALLVAFSGKYSTTTQIFAGGATKLFKFNPATLNLDDVSKVGGYSASDWSIVQFGNVVLAADSANKIQAWTMGTSSVFADVAAAAPVAKYLTIVRDFVVAGYLDGGTNANKVQWCDINDETNWTAGAASQSDYQILSQGTNITGMSGGEFGLIFMEKAIIRMNYVGSPFFFQFSAISTNLGCMDGGTIAQFGSMTYFLSDNGFYSCDGTNVTAIGNEKVDKYFFTNMDINKLSTMSAAIDPVKKIVAWNYPNISGGRSLLLYNYQVNKWSRADTTANYINSIATAGFTLDQLDIFGTVNAGSFVIGQRYTIQTIGTTDFTLYGAPSNTIGLNFEATGVGAGTGTVASIDVITTSFDDRLWSGGKFLFAGVTGSKISTFTGANMTANLTTSDIEQGYNSVVTLARPQIDNGSCSVAVASRKELDDTITFGDQVATTSEGRVSLRSAGRYHRFNIIPSGNWTNAIALDVEIAPQGTR